MRAVIPHCHDCTGDCCNWDAFTDALATGQDIYTSTEEIPTGRGLRRYKHLTAQASPEASADC